MHFTYTAPEEGTLRQGDILINSGDLYEVIKEIHPHYSLDQYKYFQVLTQSCDLVRRVSNSEEKCKARYITLAAVRTLDDVIKRFIDESVPNNFSFDNKICCGSRYEGKLKEFLRKLFNNNESNHFFLRSDEEFGFYEDCCTLLHLSIAIRAYQHYDKCLKAKKFELNEVFRAKLGWLVGNIYSRVGTQDFAPGTGIEESDFNNLIDETIKNKVVILPPDLLKIVSKDPENIDINSALETVEENKELQKKNKLQNLIQVIDQVVNLDQTKKTELYQTLYQQKMLNPIFNKSN